MKYIYNIFLICLIAFVLNSCVTEKGVTNPIILDLSDSKAFKIELNPGSSFNHPTFSIWLEDMNGDYIKTLFVTEAYASGIFGHEMVGDSIWLPSSGKSIQPAALPYWSYKKGLINNKVIIPTPENPYVDGYTGATPEAQFTLFNDPIKSSNYRVMLEVNQAWDWNRYWTNNKFPTNDAYKHSAQPSLVYAVTVNDQGPVFCLNPIGHGSPTGENGKLSTDLSTLTTAMEIFSSIRITIKN